MRTSLKALMMAIPLMFASFGGYAVAADCQALVRANEFEKVVLFRNKRSINVEDIGELKW